MQYVSIDAKAYAKARQKACLIDLGGLRQGTGDRRLHAVPGCAGAVPVVLVCQRHFAQHEKKTGCETQW